MNDKKNKGEIWSPSSDVTWVGADRKLPHLTICILFNRNMKTTREEDIINTYILFKFRINE